MEVLRYYEGNIYNFLFLTMWVGLISLSYIAPIFLLDIYVVYMLCQFTTETTTQTDKGWYKASDGIYSSSMEVNFKALL